MQAVRRRDMPGTGVLGGESIDLSIVLEGLELDSETRQALVPMLEQYAASIDGRIQGLQVAANGTAYAPVVDPTRGDTAVAVVDPDGNVTLADEVHTPDSSRFWVLDSYADRHANGEEPVSLDKEFLRLWLRDKGISDSHIPELDDDIRIQVAERYIDLFQRVTGTEFEAEISDLPILERIEERIAEFID